MEVQNNSNTPLSIGIHKLPSGQAFIDTSSGALGVVIREARPLSSRRVVVFWFKQNETAILPLDVEVHPVRAKVVWEEYSPGSVIPTRR